ncbi:MAG: MotA/TolQ/ExbB proton channel family protein [Phycisphaerales bacterium]
MHPLPSRLILLAQDAAAPAGSATSKSILEYIQDGGILSYVLVIVSFIAVALIVRNILMLRRSRLAPPEVLARLESELKQNDVEGALAVCTAPGNDSFLSRVFGAALLRCSRSPFGFLELRTALEESGQREADRLHRANDGVGIIAAVGPMLGLLGTVVGMIGAFATIGGAEASARSQELAKFMSIALVCTAEGLIVAIPCTVAFAMFRRHIDHLVGEIAEQIEFLTRTLEQHGDERGAAPSAPARAGKPAAAARSAPAGPARGVQVS